MFDFIVKNMSLMGFCLGVLVAAGVGMAPFQDISGEAQRCLALSLLVVVWWATGVTHPGHVSAFLLGSYILLKVAPASVVFSLWTTPIIYLVIGGYLIASAVRESGLGKRIAYIYVTKYISSYRSIIIGAYALGFLLSFLIPHPWPRSFLIMSVMLMVIKGAKIPPADAANIGLAVFASSCPTSAILLTGNSVLNTMVVDLSGAQLTWLGWLWQMGVPGIAATLLTLVLQLKIYTPAQEISIDIEEFKRSLRKMGSLSIDEKKCLLWIGLAVVMWATDGFHHVHPGWIALMASIGMALPKIGGILKADSWNDVPIATLLFMTAALAIGKVGSYTGMNEWLATVVFPEHLPENPFVLATLTTAIGIAVHMALGSVLAVMGILVPIFMVQMSGTGINPLFFALMLYAVLTLHYLLPFHHMNILVGHGDGQGGYSGRDVLRLGLPLTVIIFFITVGIMVPWWKVTGLI